MVDEGGLAAGMIMIVLKLGMVTDRKWLLHDVASCFTFSEKTAPLPVYSAKLNMFGPGNFSEDGNP